MRIIGIDPGSKTAGYGCIDVGPRGRMNVVEHGSIHLGAAAFHERLLKLDRELSGHLERLRPNVLVLERIFFAQNAASALKLGQARGVILLGVAKHSLELGEWSVAEVKQVIAGNGRAEKAAVARALSLLFGTQTFETWDASDALALAVCQALGGPHGMRRNKGIALSLGLIS